jgi:hypothetical protein
MSGPLRLLLVTSARGAPWSSACLLAGALPLDRFRPTLAVVGTPPDALARNELNQLAPNAAVTILEGPLETDRDAWTTMEELRAKLRLLCEQLRPDVVHVSQLSLGRLACAAPRVVTAVHDLASFCRATGKTLAGSGGTDGAIDVARYKAEVKAGLAGASVVVAPSAFMARELERHYKLDDGVRVIRHGAHAASRAVTERGLVAVACGASGLHDDASHRIDLLTPIAAGLPGHVGVVGEPPGRALPAPLVNLGRPGRRELTALMAGARVFIGLARYDPTAQVVADAQATGARLVLLDNPTYRELWTGAADLVHDAESLATAVRRAAAAPRQPRPAAPRYAISQTAAAYTRLYEELLSSGARAAA